MNCAGLSREYHAVPAPESHHLLGKHQHSRDIVKCLSILLLNVQCRIFWLPAYAGQLMLGTWCRMGGRVGPFGVFWAALDVTA